MTQPRDIAQTNRGTSTGPAGIDGPGDADVDDDVLLVRMDRGDANRRILARTEFVADFRRVEAASLKFKVRLGSAEGKRALHRYFYSFQANLYVVSSIGRLKLTTAAVEKVEQAMRSRLESAAKTLNRAIDAAERLFKKHAIETPATFDALPLEVAVGVIDSLGRRYLELIQKLDQLMPLLQTLEIWEVVRQRDVNFQRARMKRLVRDLASTARAFALGTRKRSSAVDVLRQAQVAKFAAVITAKKAAKAVTDPTTKAEVMPVASASDDNSIKAVVPIAEGPVTEGTGAEPTEADIGSASVVEAAAVSETQPAL